jgi:hypothetical protein
LKRLEAQGTVFWLLRQLLERIEERGQLRTQSALTRFRVGVLHALKNIAQLIVLGLIAVRGL